jgi:DtxR family Mn-dependent transcriptional regulator
MRVSENIEEYLEILWIFEEEGTKRVKINEIASMLKIAPPSAVEMLKKMSKIGLVRYETRKGVSLTERGREVARQVIRNHRLAELLLTEVLNTEIDEEVVCGFEHHFSKKIADAVCTSLNHPEECPHGKPIPRGECCLKDTR